MKAIRNRLGSASGAARRKDDDVSVPHRASAEERAAEVRKLSRPFWATVAIGGFSLLAVVMLLAWFLDQSIIRTSEQIFRSVLRDRTERLEQLAKNHAQLSGAVADLAAAADMDWADTALSDANQYDFQVDAIHVLTGANHPMVNLVDGKAAVSVLEDRYGPQIKDLIARARVARPREPPAPVSGLIGTLPSLHLVSAVVMSETRDGVSEATDHVLVFGQTVGDRFLNEIARKYQLPGLHLSTASPGPQQAGLRVGPLGDGKTRYFIWSPALPGQRLLPLLGVGVLIVYGCMYLTARMFFRSAADLVKALAEAKFQAEQTREMLAEQVRQDPLTGLGNRRYLDEKLEELDQAPVPPAGHALLFLDLDRFKGINDTHGHEIGDEVLRYVGKCLSALAREADTVLRLGGDEFIVIFGDAGKDRILASARAILEQLNRDVTLRGVPLELGASVGVAFSPNPTQLLRQADMALYAAKRQGRGQVSVYSGDFLEQDSIFAADSS